MMRGLKTLSRVSKVRLILHICTSTNTTFSCVTIDKKFLEFFFKRVKVNTSGRYEAEFPYISPCGRETNYIRCDDLPIVFSQLLGEDGVVVEDIVRYGSSPSGNADRDSNCKRTNKDGSGTAPTALSPSTCAMDGRTVSSTIHSPVMASLAYGGTLGLTVPFQPTTLCMLPATGRVYHAGPDNLGGVGLVKSSLAIELSRFFVYEDGAREHAHPVGFRWQGNTWQLDSAVLTRLKKLTSITD